MPHFQCPQPYYHCVVCLLLLCMQPLHPCLFPQCCRFAHFNRVTNPYEAVFDGVAVLGHAGQPVSDIARQRIDGPLKAQDEAGTYVFFACFLQYFECAMDSLSALFRRTMRLRAQISYSFTIPYITQYYQERRRPQQQQWTWCWNRWETTTPNRVTPSPSTMIAARAGKRK